MELNHLYPLCVSVHRLTFAAVIVLLLLAASFGLLAGNASAMQSLPPRAYAIIIGDPCRGCHCPTPTPASKANGPEPRPTIAISTGPC
jgi:hypothetical protein